MPTRAEIAAGFGYSLAFFDADPELRALLNRAVAGAGYTTARFIAELQNTKWFRRHSESYRKFIALQRSDPATLRQLQSQAHASLASTAQQMGAQVSYAELQRLATNAIQFGWTPEQQQRALASYVTYKGPGKTFGNAATNAARFRQIAEDYGIGVSDQTMGSWVKSAALGTINEAFVQQWASAQAASRYPGLASQLKAGQTVREIADPYIESYAKLLELNPETIKLSDKLIQGALTAKDPKGKPTVKTVWQFEQELRNDPRWVKTQGAQDEVMATARRVLQDFGFSQ